MHTTPRALPALLLSTILACSIPPAEGRVEEDRLAELTTLAEVPALAEAPNPLEQLPLADRLEAHVRHLCERDVARDWSHPTSLDEAASYIAGHLRGAGGRVEMQGFRAEGETYRNVRAFFGPAQGERIVVGAHYDVAGELPGADDNASGVAVLLEIARGLGSIELASPVELVAYTLEEPPFFRTESMGSAVHARALASEGVNLRAMINLEMVGYFTDEPDSQEFPTDAMELFYPTTGNFITVVGRPGDAELVEEVHASMDAASDLPVVILLAQPSVPGVDFSDHLNYWELDQPAVMLTDTSFYRNSNYHTEDDTPDTLDYQRMAQVVEGSLAAILALADH